MRPTTDLVTDSALPPRTPDSLPMPPRLEPPADDVPDDDDDFHGPFAAW
jgi:hypothetical protein